MSRQLLRHWDTSKPTPRGRPLPDSAPRGPRGRTCRLDCGWPPVMGWLLDARERGHPRIKERHMRVGPTRRSLPPTATLLPPATLCICGQTQAKMDFPILRVSLQTATPETDQKYRDSCAYRLPPIAMRTRLRQRGSADAATGSPKPGDVGCAYRPSPIAFCFCPHPSSLSSAGGFRCSPRFMARSRSARSTRRARRSVIVQ